MKFGGEFRRYLVANFSANIGVLTYTSLTTNFENDTATVFSSQIGTVSSRNYDNALGVFYAGQLQAEPAAYS